MKNSKKLVLASASPRRKDLLSLAGYSYEVIPSAAEEISGGKSPEELVAVNALEKAREVSKGLGEDFAVLGADTVVALDGRILGKPKDEQDAFQMLESLSGSLHSVLTGYALVCGDWEKSGVCETKVKFRELSHKEIWDYIATKEPLDKAGAYGIQERASLFAEYFHGDFFNIIGLPVAKIYPILAEMGIVPDWQKDEP